MIDSRDYPLLALICHECNQEYDDPRGLDVRDVGAAMCVSCPSCGRDLAIFDCAPLRLVHGPVLGANAVTSWVRYPDPEEARDG